MARNTITDVRERVSLINEGTDVELSFNAWGTGRNKYQLVNDETGETYGPICIGASEFLKVLSAFNAGRKVR